MSKKAKFLIAGIILAFVGVCFVLLVCSYNNVALKNSDLNLSSKDKNETNLRKKVIKVVIKDKNVTIKTDENSTKVFDENVTTTDENLSDNRYFLDLKCESSKKPKLAIIIDDVATKKQIEYIKNSQTLLTPSFLPPANNHKNSDKLVDNFDYYMIHLPLEAMNFSKPEAYTLTTNMNYDEIEKFIAKLRELYPKAEFINNHTGSKFTSNVESMKMLLKAMQKYNFAFIDSKTISNSALPELAKEYNMKNVYREVFLDNINEVSKVRKMIEQAVKIAKKRGFAIAIGHPRKPTMQALKESKDLLDQVELVKVSEIYGCYK